MACGNPSPAEGFRVWVDQGPQRMLEVADVRRHSKGWLLSSRMGADARVRGHMRAFYRGRRNVRPTAESLRGSGHHLLMTRYGPLDVLGVVAKESDFQALRFHSRRRLVGGTRVQVLDLKTQIAVKEELGFPKDRAALPILRAALEEQKRR